MNRAVRGAAVLLGRNLTTQVITFVATIVLARLLSPKDFGAFAIASVVQQSGIVIVNFGLPASLIRRPHDPSTLELEACSAFIFILGVSVTAVIFVCAVGLFPALHVDSRVPLLAAIACSSLPILGAQVTPVVLLNRKMDFRKVALIEIADSLAFYAFAVAAAAAGLGPFSLAGAVPIAALVSLLVARTVQPWKWRFRFALGPLRSLAGFGVQAGAFESAIIGRELSFVSALSAVGGQTMAGFYGMARRLFALPYAAMTAIQRVAMPAFAQTQSNGERARRAAQAESAAILAIGLPMALVAGAARPLVSVLFGSRWLPAAALLTSASPGVLLFAAVGTVLVSLFFANGKPRPALEATALQLLTMLSLVVALVPGGGARGAGVALSASFIVFCGVVVIRAPSSARVVGRITRGFAVAAVAAAVGHFAGPGTSPADLVLALVATASCWLVLAQLVASSDFRMVRTLMGRHLLGDRGRIGRSSRRGSPTPMLPLLEQNDRVVQQRGN